MSESKKPAKSPQAVTRAEARAHFRNEARSLRSLQMDAARRRRGRVLTGDSPQAELYMRPGGSRRWDFRGVDDGSAVARQPLGNIAGFQRLDRELDELPPRLQRAVQRGREIGVGGEATVWAYGNRAYKVFKRAVGPERVKRQIAFLRDNAASGRVPVLYDSSEAQRWLELELLTAYEPLGRYRRSARWQRDREDPAKLAALLRGLGQARADLKRGTEYADVANLNNIALAFDRRGLVSDVKFYEGGRAEAGYEQRELVLGFLQSLVRQLQLSKRPAAAAILRRDRLPAGIEL